MSETEEERYKTYEEDPRIPCRYGVKCYQKNPVHHEKYKHPPKKEAKKQKTTKRVKVEKKRKISETKDDDEASTDSPEKKVQKTNSVDTNSPTVSSSPDNNNQKNVDQDTEHVQESLISLLKDCNINTETDKLSVTDAQTVITNLFLTEMPEDFFQFYELCKSISEQNPLAAFKHVRLQLVGPYDVFRDKFLQSKISGKEKLLRHWRYYYDPPEFQTIIKVDDEEGLHFGYWRDDATEKPVFVARNRAEVDCLIEPVAENIFGVVDAHLEEQIKSANPFEKPRIIRLHQKLKNYAKEKNITLEKKTADMRNREKKVVAKTFHKAGIVVPYNKKTQLGYRELSVTDNELQKILKQIEEAASSAPMLKLEEVMRLATIAADECDFGTCLELGHDLFSSGIAHVQKKALQMLSIAYTHLQRPQLLEIAKAHLQDRRKGSDLSVL